MKKHYLVITATLLILFAAFAVKAQQVEVKGKVTDASDGAGLPGVNILEKGTTNGSLTDGSGNFSIKVNSDAVLVFSFVGFVTQEIPVAGQTVLNVTMESDTKQLDEIVVIGYGHQEKKDLTGSVTAVTAKDFNRGVLTSPQDLLVGKIAGVQVTTNSGAPGGGATIRIRGGSSLNALNDPLVVIDGFPVDNGKAIGGSANPLATINPNDIESFTVLKDASATAIYGSRASNGVIIVTTKKGKEGKPHISYNGNFSASSPAKYFDVLSGDELRDLAAELVDEDIVDGLDAAALDQLGNANTDWQKEIYRTALSHDHNVSVSGSVKNLPYRVSYGYTDQQGILKTTSSKRHSLNINLSPTFLDDHLKVTVNAKGSSTNNNFGNTGAIGAAVGFDPTQPVMNGNTRWGGYFTWVTDPDNVNSDPIDLSPSNPVALLNLTNNTATVNRLLGNIQADYRFHFLPELRVNVNVGLDYTKSDGVNNTSILAPWATDVGEGQKIDYTGKNVSKLFDIYFNYVKEFGSHKIDLTAGHSYQSFRNEGSNFSRNWDETKFYDSEIAVDGEGDPVNVARQYVPDLNYLLSFFGRAFYSFKDRYLFTVTLRSDGSSRFAKDNRWGLFPAAAFAWKINEEPFMATVETVSNLKLRLGYGVTGQQNIGDNANNPAYKTYPYLPIYVASTPTAQYQFGNAFYDTYRPNPYDGLIKWEETTTYNAGIDFGFMQEKLTGTLDVYKRKTKDLINFIPVAAGSAFSNFLVTNVGDLENTGVELTLNAKVIDKREFGWNIGFNLFYNRNEITKLTRVDDPGYLGVDVGAIEGGVGNKVQIHSVGYPAYSYFVFEQVYDEATGLPIEGLYVDRSGNGGSVSSDNRNRYRYHQQAPDVLMGVNSTLRYKNFDLYFQGRISLGNYAYNNRAAASTYSAIHINAGYFNNLARYIFDAPFVNPQYWSDYYVENASFFKMDNISLGYNFDHLLTQKLRARIGLTVQNAFVITKYSGIDPEVNDGTDPGIDKNIYPRPRTFVLSLNLTY